MTYQILKGSCSIRRKQLTCKTMTLKRRALSYLLWNQSRKGKEVVFSELGHFSGRDNFVERSAGAVRMRKVHYESNRQQKKTTGRYEEDIYSHACLSEAPRVYHVDHSPCSEMKGLFSSSVT